jgi:hypothetical protein
MPLPVQALLLCFVFFVLTMKTFWLIALLISLAAVFITGFKSLWLIKPR